MTELKEFRLPDVGEGLTEADIVAWHVKPGDQVEVNQIIVEIETAKAVVELPSPWDGTVARLLASEGQTVDVGAPIIAVDVSGTAAGGESAAAGKTDDAERSVVHAPATAGQLQSAESQQAGSEPAESQPDQAGRQPVLVGYGVRASSTMRRARKTAPLPAAPAAPAAPAVPRRSNGVTGMILGLGSMGLGVGATAVVVSHHVAAGAAVFMVLLIWLAIAVINIAYSRR
jgi:2-oxoisovalerate dehydrogenase E2 component (dihydrolipoyl transacylase)